MTISYYFTSNKQNLLICKRTEKELSRLKCFASVDYFGVVWVVPLFHYTEVVGNAVIYLNTAKQNMNISLIVM